MDKNKTWSVYKWAENIGVCPKTVYNWIEKNRVKEKCNGKADFIKIGDHFFIIEFL